MLQKRAGITAKKMYNTFNMGIGLAICVEPKDVDKTIKKLSELGEQAVVFATIEKGEGFLLYNFHIMRMRGKNKRTL